MAPFGTKAMNISWRQCINWLFWAIGIAILVGLTVFAFLPLLDEYQNYNFATQIQIMGKNKSVQPPLVTLCIPWTGAKLVKIVMHMKKVANNETSKCPTCELMAAQGWDVWKEIRFTDVDDYRQAIAAKMMAKLMTEENFDALSVDNHEWNKPLIDAAWDFLDCLQELDLNVGLDEKAEKFPLWCFYKYTNMSDYFLGRANKINQLFRRVIEVLCEYLEFRNRKYLAYDKSLCVETLSGSPSVVFGQQFCFAWPTHDRNLSQALITSNPHSRYGPRGPGSNDSNVTHVSLYTDIDRVVSLVTDSSPINDRIHTFPIYVSDGTDDYVRLGYSVTATVIEKRGLPCYSDRSPTVCRSYCIVNKIMTQCKCVPFAFSTDMMNVTDSYCTNAAYAKCKFNKVKESQRCDAECIIQCNYVSYQWIVSRVGHDSNRLFTSRRYDYEDGYAENRKRFEIGLYPISTTFIQFDVVTKNTPTQFLSQVAAICNLYLGFSGLSAIGFLIFCGKLLMSWYSTAKGKQSPIGANVSAFGGPPDEKHDMNEPGQIRASISTLEKTILDIGKELDNFRSDTLKAIEARLTKIEERVHKW